MAQHMSAIGPFGLRMPAALHRVVKRAAKENRRSMNSEIITVLERFYRSAAAGEEFGDQTPAASRTGALASAHSITHG